MNQEHAKPLKEKSQENPEKTDSDKNFKIISNLFDIKGLNSVYCSQYVADIFKTMHLNKNQKVGKFLKQSFQEQPLIGVTKRCLLFEWLSGISEYLDITQLTLQVCYKIHDHFLYKQKVKDVRQYQMVGIVCLFLACKMEQRQYYSLEKLIELSDSCCSYQDAIRSESVITELLDYDLDFITAEHYMKLYMRIIEIDEFGQCFLKYLLEVITLDIKFMDMNVNLVACGCIYFYIKFKKLLSFYKEQSPQRRKLFEDNENWPYLIQFTSGYKEKEVKKVAKNVCVFLSKYQNQENLYNFCGIKGKYALEKYCKVSKIKLDVL